MTQRGVDRRSTFASDTDRSTYLQLLRENLEDAQVGILGWSLMTNHVHLVAMPEREDSLSVLFRRVHGRYAQYFNAHMGRTGHLWQNRFFACALGPTHLWAALAYVERNPVRAGMVANAADYPWSSAAAHVSGHDAHGILDMDWWQREALPGWSERLAVEESDSVSLLRRCTYAGRPFGEQEFVEAMGEKFGRHWTRGRPKKERSSGTAKGKNRDDQWKLF